jgi:hypothetical protein
MRKLTRYITLAGLMQRIRNTGGQFQFSYVTSGPGITYRDPAGNLIAAYEKMDWDGKVWVEIYRCMDMACHATGKERDRILGETKARTLGGRKRFAVECEDCDGVHVPGDDCDDCDDCDEPYYDDEWGRERRVSGHYFDRERWGCE